MYKVKKGLTLNKPILIEGHAGTVIILSDTLNVKFDENLHTDISQPDNAENDFNKGHCVVISECEIQFYKTQARSVTLKKNRKLKQPTNITIEQTLISNTKHLEFNSMRNLQLNTGTVGLVDRELVPQLVRVTCIEIGNASFLEMRDCSVVSMCDQSELVPQMNP